MPIVSAYSWCITDIIRDNVAATNRIRMIGSLNFSRKSFQRGAGEEELKYFLHIFGGFLLLVFQLIPNNVWSPYNNPQVFYYPIISDFNHRIVFIFLYITLEHISKTAILFCIEQKNSRSLVYFRFLFFPFLNTLCFNVLIFCSNITSYCKISFRV